MYFGSKKDVNHINNIGVGFCNTAKFIGANDQIVPSHGASSGSFVSIIDIGRVI